MAILLCEARTSRCTVRFSTLFMWLAASARDIIFGIDLAFFANGTWTTGSLPMRRICGIRAGSCSAMSHRGVHNSFRLRRRIHWPQARGEPLAGGLQPVNPDDWTEYDGPNRTPGRSG